MRRTSTHRGNEAKFSRNILAAAALILALATAQAKAASNNTPGTVETPTGQDSTSIHRQLIISIPDRKLAVVEDGEVVKIYPVAVGKPSTPSPTGEFKIVNHIKNPTYYHKGVVIRPGPANPLGNRWMGLSLKGYGIHGTNEQDSIGYARSHGCIRMAKHDVEELFSRVSVGDEVEIHAHRDAELAAIFEPETGTKNDQEETAQPAPVVVAAAMTGQR